MTIPTLNSHLGSFIPETFRWYDATVIVSLGLLSINSLQTVFSAPVEPEVVPPPLQKMGSWVALVVVKVSFSNQFVLPVASEDDRVISPLERVSLAEVVLENEPLVCTGGSCMDVELEDEFPKVTGGVVVAFIVEPPWLTKEKEAAPVVFDGKSSTPEIIETAIMIATTPPRSTDLLTPMDPARLL